MRIHYCECVYINNRIYNLYITHANIHTYTCKYTDLELKVSNLFLVAAKVVFYKWLEMEVMFYSISLSLCSALQDRPYPPATPELCNRYGYAILSMTVIMWRYSLMRCVHKQTQTRFCANPLIIRTFSHQQGFRQRYGNRPVQRNVPKVHPDPYQPSKNLGRVRKWPTQHCHSTTHYLSKDALFQYASNQSTAPGPIAASFCYFFSFVVSIGLWYSLLIPRRHNTMSEYIHPLWRKADDDPHHTHQYEMEVMRT